MFMISNLVQSLLGALSEKGKNTHRCLKSWKTLMLENFGENKFNKCFQMIKKDNQARKIFKVFYHNIDSIYSANEYIH